MDVLGKFRELPAFIHSSIYARKAWTSSLRGHFRVSLFLCFKTSLRAKPFMRKWVWFAWKLTCRRNSFPYEWFRGKRQLGNGLLADHERSMKSITRNRSLKLNLIYLLITQLSFSSRLEHRAAVIHRYWTLSCALLCVSSHKILIHFFQLLQHCPPPGNFWPASLSSPNWCPSQGNYCCPFIGVILSTLPGLRNLRF